MIESLLGKTFEHGVQDCFTIVRDFYKLKFGIEMKNYARPERWWENGGNLYLENYELEGFVRYPYDPKILKNYDILLFYIRSKVPNHAAIYIDNHLLHHLPNRLSSLDPFNSFWRSICTDILRHPKVLNFEEQIPFKELEPTPYWRMMHAKSAE